MFLHAFKDRQRAIHKELFKKVTKKRRKLQKKMQHKMPKLLEHISHLFSAFLTNELPRYLLSIDQNERVQSFESQFNKKVEQYHRTVASYGKKADKSVKSLHKVRIQAKKLRYMYADLSARTGQDFSSKEKEYKAIQSQFGDINDVQDWLQKLRNYEKKLDVPKKEILITRKRWENRLNAMIRDVELKPSKTRAG